MTDKIRSALQEVEQKENARILFACESGSRAWGFASNDSDWDVRFVYARPIEWYLSTEKRSDVIERMMPDDIDLAGWDIRKALTLLRKSNPPFYEWLRSPIVYKRDEVFFEKLMAISREYYSPERCFLHYLHMAQGNFRDYLRGEVVWLKKYLYVLRPIVACKWIELGLNGILEFQTPVPMEFEIVCRAVIRETKVLDAIDALVVRKKSGLEKEMETRIPVVSDFIEFELERLSTVKVRPSIVPGFDLIDRLVFDTLGLRPL